MNHAAHPACIQVRVTGGTVTLHAIEVLALIFVAGCAHFEPQPLSPDETATRFSARTLNDPGLKRFLDENLKLPLQVWPVESWDFPKLTLVAWHFHPSLDVARAQWRVADIAIATAGGRPKSAKPGEHPLPPGTRPNPAVTLTPEYNSSATRGASPWAPSISFDAPLETAGKRAQRIAKAEHLAESARFRVATVAWQVRANLHTNLLNHLAAQRRLELLNRLSELQTEIIRRMEQQQAAGAISWREIAPFHTQLAKTFLGRLDALDRVMQSRVRVADALGLPVEAVVRVELSYDFSRRADGNLMSQEVRRMALHSRSDILSALADYAAAEAALRLEIAKQYPNVHLNPGYQWDQGESKWALGVKLELPAFNQNRGPIAEAEAHRAEAAARFLSLQAKVLADIDRGTTTYRAAEQRLTDLDALLAAYQKQRDVIEARLKAGAAERLEVLTAELQVVAAQLAKFDGQEKLQLVLAVLEDAVQQPGELMDKPMTVGLKPPPILEDARSDHHE